MVLIWEQVFLYGRQGCILYLSSPWVTIILKTLQLLHFELVIGRPDVSNMKDVFCILHFLFVLGWFDMNNRYYFAF